MKKQTEQADEPAKKKGKKKWIVIAVVVVIILAAAIGGGGGSDTDEAESQASSTEVATETEAATETEQTEVDETEQAASYELEYGELVSAVENEIDGQNVLVIKAKITSSYSNTATVDQNYYNVEDLITGQGCDSFDEIQYWAVADMSDGSEEKVVSFTVSAELIQKIAAGEVVTNQLGDYVDDLYIHASLSE